MQIEAERAGIEKEFGVKAFYDGADMPKPAEIAAMIADAQAKMGSLDILVNNAGIQFVSPIEDFPIEKWDAIIAINLSSAFHAIRAAVPGMKAQKWGRIVSTASAHSLVASPFKSAYVSAKHGLAGLTKTVALELATFGVTANCISPGYVWTPLVENQIPDTMKARNMTREQVINDVMLARPADQAIRHRRPGRRARRLSVLGRRVADHRRQSVDRRRLDGGVSATRKVVNLALQGGGSHGAYSLGRARRADRGRAHRNRRHQRRQRRRDERRRLRRRLAPRRTRRRPAQARGFLALGERGRLAVAVAAAPRRRLVSRLERRRSPGERAVGGAVAVRQPL